MEQAIAVKKSVTGKKKPLVRKRAASHVKKPSQLSKERTGEAASHEEQQRETLAPREKAGARYIYAIGRRKTAMVKLRLRFDGKKFTVNTKPFQDYFQTPDLQRIVTSPLNLLGIDERAGGEMFAHGGGKHAQAEAARHAIARALVFRNAEDKPTLKKAGFLTRDPRVKERKKPGLKRARRGPQWAKR